MVIDIYDSNFIQGSALQILLAIAFLSFFIQWLRKKSVKVPPGPIGLPFFGYLPFLGDEPSQTLTKLAKKYGNIFSLRMGRQLLVVLNDYETMKEVLDHPSSLDRAVDLFSALPHLGFGIANGVEWNEQRRFFLRSSKELGLGRKNWEEMIHDEVEIFMEFLRSHNDEPVDVKKRLHEILGNIIISFLIGRRIDKNKERKILNMIADYSENSFNELAPDTITSQMPLLRKALNFFGIVNYDEKFKVAFEFINFLRQEIERHKTETKDENMDYFLNTYSNKIEEMKNEKKEHFFTVTNLEGNLHVLFLGGSGTIFSVMVWLFALMAKYPDVQRKVHDELHDVLGEDRKMFYEDRGQCPYTMAVIMETQRYASVVPLSTGRSCAADFEYRGYTIPKGTQISANLRAIHYDPAYWKEPEKFDPTRFLTEDGKKVLNNPMSYAPFSSGRRQCPAGTVGMMELLIFFATIVQKFNILPPPGREVKFNLIKGLVYGLDLQPLLFVERN